MCDIDSTASITERLPVYLTICWRWLNEDLVLKRRVLNLEEDFSNGYLLGEILHVHNHQHNFHLFKKEGDPVTKSAKRRQEYATSEAKVTNFILLEPSLRLLGVEFDSQVAYAIMQAKPGVATQLLHQIKMVFDRLAKFSTPVSMVSTTCRSGVKPLPNIRQRATKPLYDEMTHAIFAAAVRDMVKSQKEINLERSLERFAAESMRQKILIQNDNERSLIAKQLRTEAIRQQRLQNMAQRKALCDSWEDKNIETWLINMGRKYGREHRINSFLQNTERARMTWIDKARMAAERIVRVDLTDFEERSQEAARTAGGNQDDRETTPCELSASTQGFLEARALEKGYEWQMAKFRAKYSGERAAARQTRRRRFIREREESESNHHLREGTEVLTQKLMRRYRAEEQVEQQLQGIQRYKAIMAENRMYRDQQYAARAEIDGEGVLKRDQASLNSFRRDYELLMQAQSERHIAAVATGASAAATRGMLTKKGSLLVWHQIDRNEKMCRETLDGLISLSLEVVRYRAYSEHRREPDASERTQDPMPCLQWTDMKRSFVRGGPLLCMDSLEVSAGVSARKDWGCTTLLPIVVSDRDDESFSSGNGDDDVYEDVAIFLDRSELGDYIAGKGWWATQGATTTSCSKPPSIVSDGIAGDVTKAFDKQLDGANTFSSRMVPDRNGNRQEAVLGARDAHHALGECIVETRLAANPPSPPPPPPMVPRFSLRICLLGKTFTGKSEQAIRLADRYYLKVLSAEELTQRAMDNAANAMAAGRRALSKNEALGQEAISTLMKGGTVPDKVYAALVVEAIKEIERENAATRKAQKDATPAGHVKTPPSEDDHHAEYMGWIIDDFPNSAKQAALLEKYLSGYDEATLIPSGNDAASRLAPVAPTLPDATDNKGANFASGVDLLIYLHAPRETILKRSLGRLYDPVMAEAYHFEGTLPQYHVVCNERLVRPQDPANPSAQLSAQLSVQDKSSQELKAFAARVWTLRTVESGEATPEALFGMLNSVVLDFIDQQGPTVEEEEKVPYGRYIHDGIAMDQEEGKLQHTLEDVIGDSQTNGNPAESPGDTSNAESPSGEQEEAASRALEQNDSGGLSSTTENVEEPIGRGQKETGQVTAGLAIALSGHWRLAEEQFEEAAQRVFREFRNQRFLIDAHIRSLRDSFAVFLHRPDDKQGILTNFCALFNFMDEDLRFDDHARKELLLRTEECRSRLWSDIEARKESASKALANMAADGWLERQKGILCNSMMMLMQAEVERFHAGISLLHDYYHAKMQETSGDDTVAIALLLAPQSDKDGSKETQITSKSGVEKEASKDGKKTKTGKSVKSRHDNRGGRGAKGEEHQETDSTQFSGERTPFPPCVVLSTLVDVPDAGSCTQVEDNSVEPAAAPVPGKNKAGKGRNKAHEKVVGKDEALEADEIRSPLESALSRVLQYASSWGPEGFPVQDHEATPSQLQSQPQSSILLHCAVWAQADELSARCRRLVLAGETLSAAVERKADLVYRELEISLSVCCSKEAMVVETAMSMARDCIDNNKPIEFDWKLQDVTLDVDEKVRLFSAPDTRPPRPGVKKDSRIFSEVQVDRLRRALELVQHVGFEGGHGAFVSPDDVVDVFLRLAEDHEGLPECWAHMTKADMVQVVARAVDQDDVGQGTVEKVVSTIIASNPLDLLN